METQTTLYQRIGGKPAVEKLVKEFYARIFAEPQLAPFFESTSEEKLLRMQTEFFSAALDGPIEYAGLSLAHAHHGRGIQPKHFALFVDHLLQTLQQLELDDRQIRDIIERVTTYSTDITGSAASAG